jgi:hypothetical protein
MRFALLLTTAAAFAVPVASASAATTIKFAPANAACTAQAFVPSNTDPTQPALGSFISGFVRTAPPGELSQKGHPC